MIEPRVRPLQEFICDIASKHRMVIIENLCDIYALPFAMTHIENLFDFPETFLGEGDNGECDWSNWKYYEGLYSMVGEEPSHPSPLTVADFIDDCRRIWGIDLVWESNLLKRNFIYNAE